ncbi:MAG: LamG domain-containing protein [Verrucomicrobiales bacterium]
MLPDGGQGIIIQHGGPQQGYSLELKQGIPAFHLRRNQDLFTLAAPKALGEGWHQLVATLDAKGAAVLYIDGESVATGQSPGVLTAAPANGLTMGNARMAVSNDDPTPYTGLLDQAALYHRALSAEEVRERFAAPDAPSQTWWWPQALTMATPGMKPMPCTGSPAEWRPEKAGLGPRFGSARVRLPARPDQGPGGVPEKQLCGAAMGSLRADRDPGHGARRGQCHRCRSPGHAG